MNMNIGPNDDNKHRAAMKKALTNRTPDEWAELLEERIEDPLLRCWIANTIIYGWRGDGAFGTMLEEVAKPYQAEENTCTAEDKEEAYKRLGLPFVVRPNDDAIPSAVRKKLDHNRITPKQRIGKENAQKCCNWYEREVAR